MPLKLVAPIEETFTLDRSDAQFGTDGEPTRVTIRQATQAHNEKRSAIFSEVTRVMGQDSTSNEEIQLRQRWSLEELKRIEVFLTMIDCNILDEKGKPLFGFRSNKSSQELDMSLQEFSAAFGKLPPEVAEEIHEKVLKVNLTWAGPLAS